MKHVPPPAPGSVTADKPVMDLEAFLAHYLEPVNRQPDLYRPARSRTRNGRGLLLVLGGKRG